ncbi:cytochrome P450 [Aspergillus californicus]
MLSALPGWAIVVGFELDRVFPPGPPGLPFIGNLHQISIRDPWIKLNEWQRQYGPLYTLRVGPYPVVVVGTFEASHDLFDKRGRIYSSRPQFRSVKYLTKGLQPAAMPYDLKLKSHHRVYREMLDLKASQGYHNQEDIATRRLLYDIISPNGPSNVLGQFSPQVSSLLAYGERISDWTNYHTIEQQIRVLTQAVVMGGALVDVVPILNRLPRFLSQWKIQADECHKTTSKALSANAAAALQCEKSSWARAIRQSKHADDMSWEEFSYTVGELFQGGFVTLSFTLGTFLMICVTQGPPTVKAHNELQAVIGPDRLPQFEDPPKLSYLRAFIRELFRWRPVTPLGIPHLVTKNDQYQGYFISAQTAIIGNQGAMNMDRANPELPVAIFGFGRRVCPGQHIATDILTMTAARLLWAFEIIPTVDPGQIDTFRSALPGILYKAPDVKPIFRVRSERHAATITQEWLAVQE